MSSTESEERECDGGSRKRQKTIDAQLYHCRSCELMASKTSTYCCILCTALTSEDHTFRCEQAAHSGANTVCEDCAPSCARCACRLLCKAHAESCLYCTTTAVTYCKSCCGKCEVCKSTVCSFHLPTHRATCTGPIIKTAPICIVANDISWLDRRRPAAAYEDPSCKGGRSFGCDWTAGIKYDIALRKRYMPLLEGGVKHCHCSLNKVHVWMYLNLKKNPQLAKSLKQRELKLRPKRSCPNARTVPMVRVKQLNDSSPQKVKTRHCLEGGCHICSYPTLYYCLSELFIVDTTNTSGDAYVKWGYMCEEGHVVLKIGTRLAQTA